MRISKTLLVGCAALLGAVGVSVRAVDNQAQAKARAALEQKLKEMEGQPAKTVSQPAAAPTQPARRQAASEAPVIAPPPSDTAQSAKAREALRQKMRELDSHGLTAAPAQAPAQPAPAAQPAPPPAFSAPPPAEAGNEAKMREAVRQKLGEVETQPTAMPQNLSSADAATVAKQREALQQKISELESSQWPSMATSSAESQEAAAKQMESVRHQLNLLNTQALAGGQFQGSTGPMAATRPPKRGLGKNQFNFPPLQAPPLPISQEKKRRLDALLQQYDADQITPEQYHAQRAKILSEP